MGSACSTANYYFGFVNLSFSHLDVLSFALGCLFALGVQYLVTYCKNTKRASLHVLGKKKTGRESMESPGAAAGVQQHGYYPYPMPRPMPLYPDPAPASAPPPAGTTVIPWKFSSA